jgi:predicted component of type VI protein secretion system
MDHALKNCVCMHIYRFKIRFEDQDEFHREVEVRADQTFEDFHQAIVANLKLDPTTLSSFFTCNDKFRKKQEICLVDMDPEPEEEAGEGKPVFTMADSKLGRFIDDPHQKLLFVYDYLNNWTFYIELLRILPADKNTVYPRIHRSEGEIPRELSAKPGVVQGEEQRMDMSFDEDVYDPEDLDQLEEEKDLFGNRPDNSEGFEEDRF